MESADATPSTVTGRRLPHQIGPDQLRRIVELARLAPSVHNTQPWWWQASDSTTLELWADRARALPVSDPVGRNLTISCGAALHHTIVAAAATGAHPTVEHLPDGADSDLMARIELRPDHPTVDALAQLTTLTQRRTDRRRFTAWPVPEENLHHLAEAGEKWGSAVAAVTDPVLRVQVEELLDRIGMADRDVQLEVDESSPIARVQVQPGAEAGGDRQHAQRAALAGEPQPALGQLAGQPFVPEVKGDPAGQPQPAVHLAVALVGAADRVQCHAQQRRAGREALREHGR